MNVTQRSGDSVVVLGVGRRMTVEEDFGELERQLESQLRRGRRRFLLDLGRTTKLDAAGIGELVHLFSRVRSEGGRLDLLHLRRQLRDLLDLVCLTTVFRVFESESEAVASPRIQSLRRRYRDTAARTAASAVGTSPAC